MRKLSLAALVALTAALTLTPDAQAIGRHGRGGRGGGGCSGGGCSGGGCEGGGCSGGGFSGGYGYDGGCSGGGCAAGGCGQQWSQPGQSCGPNGCPAQGCPPQGTVVMDQAPAAGQFAQAPAANGVIDALDALNAMRAQRGLRPYLRDPLLTQGAMNCVSFRASHGIHGHVLRGMGDFQFLPPGAQTNTGGAEGPGWTASSGFGTCAMYDRQYTYAGAAMVVRPDGQAFCQLFVR